jgi:acyl carrier protein
MMIEDEFVIDIQDEVAAGLLSVQEVINYISQHPFAADDHVHH